MIHVGGHLREPIRELFEDIAMGRMDQHDWKVFWSSAEQAVNTLELLVESTDQLPSWIVNELSGWDGYEDVRKYGELANRLLHELQSSNDFE